MLLSKEYDVVTAGDGEEAISKAKAESPDLILLGLMMPKMDGLTACGVLKNDDITKDIPIIIWTGNKKIEYQVKGYELGVDHFILKPFNPSILKAQIRNSLRRSGHKILPTTEKVKTPKVFISYKWESDDHNNWVAKLAGDLRNAGIDACLDQWEVRYGDSFTDYMTSKISEADAMLFIMTSASVAAVEARSGKGGAVKFEIQLASSRKLAGEKFRIIPIYREGLKTAAHVRDHRYADFRDHYQYENNLQLLISDLFEEESIAPPVRGR